MGSTREAVYGTISATGNRWVVYFRATKDTTHSLSGYGEFPRADFPDVPVVDFRAGDAIRATRLPLVAETNVPHAGAEVTPLADFLRRVANYGVLVWEDDLYTPVQPHTTVTRDDREPDSDGWYTVTRTYHTFACPGCGTDHEHTGITHGDGCVCACGARYAADLTR